VEFSSGVEHLGGGRVARFNFLKSERNKSRLRCRPSRTAKVAVLALFVLLALLCLIYAPGAIEQPRDARDVVAMISHRPTPETYRPPRARHRRQAPRAMRLGTLRAMRTAVKRIRIVRVQRSAPALEVPTATRTPSPRYQPMQHVLATATGGEPHAILSVDGQTQIVTVGSRIAGKRVAEITVRGVRFAGAPNLLQVGR